jgi:uncharacterized protein
MKLRLATLALVSAVALCAADALPLFNATLTVGKEHRFVLIDAAGKTSSFLNLGESFDGYKLKAYDPKSGELSLERDGTVSRVTLVADASPLNAPMTPTRATIADADAVLTAMNFEQMMEKTMVGVRKQQKTMVDQMMGKMTPPGADRDAIVAMQNKVIDEMMSAMNFSEVKGEIAKIYSDVFSKEELSGLAGFFNSTAGKAYSEKQPEIMEKMNAVMMPRMMAVMPKVQQMMKDFAVEQKARREAAATSGASPAPKP